MSKKVQSKPASKSDQFKPAYGVSGGGATYSETLGFLNDQLALRKATDHEEQIQPVTLAQGVAWLKQVCEIDRFLENEVIDSSMMSKIYGAILTNGMAR